MKRTFLFFCLFLSSVTVASAQAMRSVYTSLSDKACKTIESNPNEGGSYRGRCPGVGGYRLELTEGDLRQTIRVVAPNKKFYDLDFQGNVSVAFSAIGQKAEWRVSGTGRRMKPVALIVRFNAVKNPENPESNNSYLIVTKITSDSACITDIVEPGVKNQNTRARELADSSASKPCKSSAQE